MKLRKLKGRDAIVNYDAVNKVDIFNFAEIFQTNSKFKGGIYHEKF